jgi:hypothetical protein
MFSRTGYVGTMRSTPAERRASQRPWRWVMAGHCAVWLALPGPSRTTAGVRLNPVLERPPPSVGERPGALRRTQRVVAVHATLDGMIETLRFRAAGLPDTHVATGDTGCVALAGGIALLCCALAAGRPAQDVAP